LLEQIGFWMMLEDMDRLKCHGAVAWCTFYTLWVVTLKHIKKVAYL